MESESQTQPDTPPASEAPKPAAPPPSEDRTRAQIHSLANFSLSDALGLPLLSKDARPQPARASTPASARPRVTVAPRFDFGHDWSSSFAKFDKIDRLGFAAIGLMVLGPLLVGVLSLI